MRLLVISLFFFNITAGQSLIVHKCVKNERDTTWININEYERSEINTRQLIKQTKLKGIWDRRTYYRPRLFGILSLPYRKSCIAIKILECQKFEFLDNQIDSSDIYYYNSSLNDAVQIVVNKNGTYSKSDYSNTNNELYFLYQCKNFPSFRKKKDKQRKK